MDINVIHNDDASEAVLFAKKCTDGHKDFSASLARRSGRCGIRCFECEVEIDKETFILLLSKNDISHLKNSDLQQRLMP